jgi:hypothetical protein
MPKPAIIQNERLRAAVVAATMGVLFVASMAIAAAMSGSAPTAKVEVGPLSADVPQTWKLRRPNPPVLGMVPQVVLQDAADKSRALFIGGVTLREAQNVQFVLALATARLAQPGMPHTVREQRVEPLRLGDLTMVRWTALDQSGGQLQHHQMAVVTRDRLQHWVLHLASAHAADQNAGAMLARDAATFDRILRSVKLAPTDAK